MPTSTPVVPRELEPDAGASSREEVFSGSSIKVVKRTHEMRHAVAVLVASLSILMSGCAAFVAPNYSADYSAVDSMKRSALAKVAAVTVQPQDASAKVNRITLRGTSLKTADGTFARYVEKAMMSDLQEAGHYNSNAARKIDLVLLKNDIDVTGFIEGSGEIEVDLSISDAGAVLLRKNYSARTTFESSFAGAVAIPKGQTEYPNLVRALLSNIYRDRSFLQAMRGTP